MTTNFRNLATKETGHLNKDAHNHYAFLDQIYTNATIKITNIPANLATNNSKNNNQGNDLAE